jgi:hypothetical protein
VVLEAVQEVDGYDYEGGLATGNEDEDNDDDRDEDDDDVEGGDVAQATYLSPAATDWLVPIADVPFPFLLILEVLNYGSHSFLAGRV